MSKSEYPFHNREISWFSFNERVLQEAQDKTVPLIERIRFLGIFSSNLDEFFRVRVPTVQRLKEYGKKATSQLHYDPSIILKEIYKKNEVLRAEFEKTYQELKDELKDENISFLNEKELNAEQKEMVNHFFTKKVQSALVPLMLSNDKDLPELNGNASYLAIKLYNKEGKKEVDLKYALIEIPTAVVSRFFVLPERGDRKHIILLDDVIRNCLKHVFAIFNYSFIEAYTIKITRDAELDIEDDVTSGLMEKLSESVKNRKTGDPVRFVHDEQMPSDLLEFLIKKVGMDSDDVVVAGGRYHNFKDYIAFPKVGGPHLRYRSMPPLDHPKLRGEVSLFEAIRKQDILLSYPYQSYDYIIHLMREAAIDPAVTSIKITIYRVVDKNSKIMHSLINAARNGKSVTAVVELKARFDEETNMMYAHKLQDEGIKVIFGASGLKVHAKILVIKRKENGKSVRYAHIGTGNYHESNAKLYSDHSLLTCRDEIASEANKVFKFFKDNYKRYQFRHLIVAPFNARQRYAKLINKEIKNAKSGKEAYIIIKVNSLHDREMTGLLYKASIAGVKIKIIARSINSVVSGVKGFSENIEAISVVDRLLEHARMLVFANGGEEKIFMGSSDWMGRNLDGRIEIMTPILDPSIKKILLKVLTLQLNDNTKARFWNKELSNPYQKIEGDQVRSQYDIYNFFKQQLKEIETSDS